MVIGRRFDAQATALTKQGRLAVYPSSRGQEACEIGAVLALREHDWLFPTYRDSVAIVTRDVDAVEALSLLRGDWHCGYDPYAYRVAPQCTPLATNTLHAVGLAHAMKVKGEDAAVLVLLGDGATSEGDTHEALNFAAVWQAPVVFLVQNNGFAISVPLAKQTAAPSFAHKAVGYGMPGKLIDGNDAAQVYTTVRDALDAARAGARSDAHRGRHLPHRGAHQRRRRDPLPQQRRGAAVARARPARAARDPPALVRRARRCGRGGDRRRGRVVRRRRAHAHEPGRVAPAGRAVRARLRDTHAGAAATACAAADGARLMTDVLDAPTAVETVTMAGALNRALADSLAADPSVLVFGEDVGTLGGVFRVTDGLAKRFGDERVFDTPLAEAGIVGTAIGMAMGGLRPVVEMQFDAFAYPAFEQVTSHLAKLHNRTRGAIKLPVVIRIPYGGGIGGVEHHCDSSEAYYTHTPGLRVVTPGTPADAYRLLRQAIDSPDPVVFLEPKRRYWSKSSEPLELDGPAIDRAAVLRAGTDVTVITYGGLVATALEAADAAKDEGYDLEVVDLRSLSPFDDETVCESVRRTGRAIVVHEASGLRRLRRRGRGARDRAVLPPSRGADPARDRARHPVPAADARGAPPAQRRPHPRRRRAAAMGRPVSSTSIFRTWAKA